MPNTTAATGKGFAIGSGVLTALSLLSAFTEKARVNQVELGEAVALSGVFYFTWIKVKMDSLEGLGDAHWRLCHGRKGTKR